MAVRLIAIWTCCCLIAWLPAQETPVGWDNKRKKEVGAFADRWWKARPKTRFVDWDPELRAALTAETKAIGGIAEGALDETVDLLWKALRRHAPKARGSGKMVIDTPYGEAWFYAKGIGRGKGLVIGLHGGGEGAGSADEAAGKWRASKCMAVYPQGIRLVHDTWNTVHGERFILTMIEIAKASWDIDPDRVYTMGFSMGGSGSWHLAGRHPDLLAGAIPAAGVLMANPKSQVPSKEDVLAIQRGLVPNVRNLAMYYYIGLADRNCQPGTYLYVADMLDAWRQLEPGGYDLIRFATYPGLAHAFPPKEPGAGIKWIEKQKRNTFPERLVWERADIMFPLGEDEDLVDRIEKRWFYWIKSDQNPRNEIIRASRKGNVIDVQIEGTNPGLAGITILLNPDMIDPAEEVVVTSGEREVWRGRPVPDFWTVLESLDEKLDRSMVFDRRIEL